MQNVPHYTLILRRSHRELPTPQTARARNKLPGAYGGDVIVRQRNLYQASSLKRNAVSHHLIYVGGHKVAPLKIQVGISVFPAGFRQAACVCRYDVQVKRGRRIALRTFGLEIMQRPILHINAEFGTDCRLARRQRVIPLPQPGNISVRQDGANSRYINAAYTIVGQCNLRQAFAVKGDDRRSGESASEPTIAVRQILLAGRIHPDA